VHAEKYIWEIPDEESLLKINAADQDDTFYSDGELFYVPVKEGSGLSYKLSYRFDIYAVKPLKRSYIFVDAQSEEILLDQNRIHTTDVPGIAVTRYSGTQPIATDSTSDTSFRLRETTRGDGIRTFNMQTDTH